MMPSGSTRIFCGIARTPYSVPAAFCHDCRSEICFQVNLSFSMAATQSSSLRSKETPKISKFLSLNSVYVFTKLGFSLRQSGHQEAQNSINTYLPRRSEREKGSPSGVSWVIAGAFLPTDEFSNRLR